jgi:hypothetical protein
MLFNDTKIISRVQTSGDNWKLIIEGWKGPSYKVLLPSCRYCGNKFFGRARDSVQCSRGRSCLEHYGMVEPASAHNSEISKTVDDVFENPNISCELSFLKHVGVSPFNGTERDVFETNIEEPEVLVELIPLEMRRAGREEQAGNFFKLIDRHKEKGHNVFKTEFFLQIVSGTVVLNPNPCENPDYSATIYHS